MFIRFFAIVLIGLSISNQAIVSASTCVDATDVEIIGDQVSFDGPMLFASTTGQKIRVSYTPSAFTNAVVRVKSAQDESFWEEKPFGVKVVPADRPVPWMGGSSEAQLSNGFMWSFPSEDVVTYQLYGGQEYHFYFQWSPSFLGFGFSGVCIEDDTSSAADICSTLECGGCLLNDEPWKYECELPEDMSSIDCGNEGGDYCPDLSTPVTPSPVTPSPVTPSPVTPSPVTPSPVTPSPAPSADVTPSAPTPAPVFQKVCRTVWAATHPTPSSPP